MDVAALILTILAALVFFDAARSLTISRPYSVIPLGLALLAIALICQFTLITGSMVHA